jgi:hypothetical protein
MGVAHAENECVGCNTEGNTVADVNLSPYGISFQPKVEYAALMLTVSRPDGTIFTRNFTPGNSIHLDLSSELTDGLYAFELRVIPTTGKQERLNGVKSEGPIMPKAQTQSGTFTVKGGKIVTAAAPEDLSKTMDVLHYDDVIITGSLCIGFDCINGESFGYCTLKLKENNLQLCFEDTSTGSFPTNDWKIQINDTTSGGASYFTLWDTDGGRRPFTIEAGAPSHSLYVEDYGRVGLGTSIPYVELHIVDGDSPTIRLDQDGSSGWAAQRWDLCGNETNFFVRDVTNGSKLCFRIQPNTPSNTLCMRSTGYVGIGTWSPGYPLEVETTGENAAFVCDRTDGAQNFMNSTTDYGQFGTVSNHPTRILVNSSWKMQLNSNNSLSMASGATCTTGGTWTDASSRTLKENIQSLTTDEAFNALRDLSPVKYNYKADKEEKHVGFIAEDAPELVATKDRKGMSPMDIAAVLTRVAQEQQKTIREQQKMLNEHRQIISELNKRIDELEKK